MGGTASLTRARAHDRISGHVVSLEQWMSRGAKALDPLAETTHTRIRETRRMLKDLVNVRISFLNMMSR